MKARKFSETSSHDFAVTQNMRDGLRQLIQARQYAERLRRNTWDFAVEISSLRQMGISHSDLRWLVCKKFVQHACEVTLPGANCRQFRPYGELTFTGRTCFVLTDSGLEFVQMSHHEVGGSTKVTQIADFTPGSPRQYCMVPTWDAHRQQLRLGDVVVKEFKVPSENEMTILAAFEEQRWSSRIDDPLWQWSEESAQQRLNETVLDLNLSQKNRLIRFIAEATGEGVRWEFSQRSTK